VIVLASGLQGRSKEVAWLAENLNSSDIGHNRKKRFFCHQGDGMMTDNRQAHRKELRVGAVLTVDSADAHHFVHTMDIGKFGMGLVGVPEQFSSGQQGLLSFDLFLDGQLQNVSVRIRIAYCIPDAGSFKTGIQFLDLASSGAALIAQYVED
jgi:hypothetical protein